MFKEPKMVDEWDTKMVLKVWDCTYEEAFRKVWDSVWYDEEGEARERPSERKPATLLTPGV